MANANLLEARAGLNGGHVAVEAGLIKVDQADDFHRP